MLINAQSLSIHGLTSTIKKKNVFNRPSARGKNNSTTMTSMDKKNQMHQKLISETLDKNQGKILNNYNVYGIPLTARRSSNKDPKISSPQKIK